MYTNYLRYRYFLGKYLIFKYEKIYNFEKKLIIPQQEQKLV